MHVRLRSFVNAMPSGKQNTFANGTRPAAVLVTVATGQPTSLVGAFEKPVRAEDGYLEAAIDRLAAHAKDVFETWRNPQQARFTALLDYRAKLGEVAQEVSFDDLIKETVHDIQETA